MAQQATQDRQDDSALSKFGISANDQASNLHAKSLQVTLDSVSAYNRDVEALNKLKDPTAIKDQAQRIMGARVDTLKGSIDSSNQNLKMMIQAYLSEAGLLKDSFGKLNSVTDEEKARIKAAEDAVTAAQADVNASATVRLWFTSRASHIAGTQKKLQAAKDLLDMVKKAIDDAVIDRLQKTDFREDLQRHQMAEVRVLEELKTGVAVVQAELNKTAAEKVVTHKKFLEASQGFEVLDARLNEVGEEFKTAKGLLVGHTQGTAAYSEQEIAVSKLERKLAETESARNAALDVMKILERLGIDLGTAEQALIRLASGLSIQFQALQAAAPGNRRIFEASLEAEKKFAEVKVASQVHDANTVLTGELTSRMGEISSAVSHQLADQVGKLPIELARAIERKEAHERATAESMEAIAKVIDDFRTRGVPTTHAA